MIATQELVRPLNQCRRRRPAPWLDRRAVWRACCVKRCVARKSMVLLLVTCRVVIERRRAVALCNRWRWLRRLNDAPRALCKQCGCAHDDAGCGDGALLVGKLAEGHQRTYGRPPPYACRSHRSKEEPALKLAYTDTSVCSKTELKFG